MSAALFLAGHGDSRARCWYGFTSGSQRAPVIMDDVWRVIEPEFNSPIGSARRARARQLECSYMQLAAAHSGRIDLRQTRVTRLGRASRRRPRGRSSQNAKAAPRLGAGTLWPRRCCGRRPAARPSATACPKACLKIAAVHRPHPPQVPRSSWGTCSTSPRTLAIRSIDLYSRPRGPVAQR